MTDDKALKRALTAELAKDQPNLNRFAELSEKLLVSDPDAVRFSVDAGHIKRLGQELVGKAETALAELIKNAYDADATTCKVTFANAEAKRGGTLIVEDDGVGMAEADIRESWMRLSTGTKLEHPLSGLYQRSRAGRKGIGRFAVQRLGAELVLETKPGGENTGYRVTFDWERDYPQGASLSQISNRLERFSKQADEQGTRLVIKNLRDPWNDQAIGRVWRSVLLLQPPFPVHRSRTVLGIDPGFGVTINGTTEAESKREWSIEKKFLDYAIAVISGKVDAEGVATFNLDSKRLEVRETHQPAQRFLVLGELEFKAHYFVFDARVVPGLAVRTITEFARTYGGVRVYRNGFRVPPYGEPNDDWLKLAFDTARRTLLIPSNNFNFFGQVMLDVEHNLLLEETSGREGLIENEAFSELQAFVRTGLEWGAKRVASLRERKVDPGKTRKPKDIEVPGRPSAALTSVISAVSSLAADSGDLRTAELIEELERVKEAQQVFEEEVEAERERAIRYEEMLRILASLGMSIAVFGHEIGGALTIVGAEIAQLKQKVRTAKAQALDFSAVEDAVARLADLGRYIVDVMSNAESRELVSVPLYAAITRFVEQFSTYLDKQGVGFETSIEPQYLRTIPIHRSELDAVLFNFMTNALKAMRRANVAHGRIRVSAERRENLAVLSFQDNGTGIPEDLHERIFDAFYTTTDYVPDEVAGPGSGLGLKIISDIAAVYGGWVKVGTPDAGFATRLDFALPLAEGQV
jgi:signal transduction histidine kinase